VRFYRTGEFLFQDGRLVWEYPRHAPTATRWTSPR